MNNPEVIKSDLAIIGGGIAGMAGALFAANRNIPTVQIGDTGGILYTSGLFDLLGNDPQPPHAPCTNPWESIQALQKELPEHPYAKVPIKHLRSAYQEIHTFLENSGLPYCHHEAQNSQIITPAGTLKTTYAAPKSMWKGVAALSAKKRCLLIDIKGLKEFKACQIAAVLGPTWPGLRSVKIVFPETERYVELYGEHLARSLDVKANREKFAAVIRPHLKDIDVVGFPAILGVYKSQKVIQDLAALLGVSIFEIPTLPVSVPGLRLKEVFEKYLPEKGVRQIKQKRVLSVASQPNGDFHLLIGKEEPEITLETKSILLASGRFLSNGLLADRHRVKESIFDLPVFQPKDRSQWHEKDFFSPKGHLINQAGIEIDDHFRPLNRNGVRAYDRLFAAGSILAHQDWKRSKCGTGLSIGTAFSAIESYQATTLSKPEKPPKKDRPVH